jgi:hypothetical protein
MMYSLKKHVKFGHQIIAYNFLIMIERIEIKSMSLKLLESNK